MGRRFVKRKRDIWGGGGRFRIDFPGVGIVRTEGVAGRGEWFARVVVGGDQEVVRENHIHPRSLPHPTQSKISRKPTLRTKTARRITRKRLEYFPCDTMVFIQHQLHSALSMCV